MANEAAMALENARLYEDARKLADRDPLTGFYNHRFLHERLGEEVVRAQRARRPLSVLMLDLDDFKLVNDTFGHLFGDRVLTFTAELIRSTLRISDVGARYGGDEFAVILPETDADDARIIAERILEAFRDHPFVGEQRGPVPLAGSIGVATFPADGRTATDLIAAADDALCRQAGRRPRRWRRDGRGRHRRLTASGRVAHARWPGSTTLDPPSVRVMGVDVAPPDPHPVLPDVSEPPMRQARPRGIRRICRIRRSWLVFAGTFIPLMVVALARVLTSGGRRRSIGSCSCSSAWPAWPPSRTPWRSPASMHDTGARWSRSRGILSGLSRSVSPDAIVDAIVEELGDATQARTTSWSSAGARNARARGAARQLATRASPIGTRCFRWPTRGPRPPGGRPSRPAAAVERIARRVRTSTA